MNVAGKPVGRPRPRKSPAAEPERIPETDDYRRINGSTPTTLAPFTPDDDDQVPQTADDRLVAMMEAASGLHRSVVKVYKQTPRGTWGVCGDLTPEEYEATGVNGLRDRWGAGMYEAWLYGEKDGVFGRRAYMRMEILPDPNPTRGVSGAAAAAPSSDLARVLETLAAGQQRMLELLAQPRSNQIDETLTLMARMREVFGGATAPAPPPTPVAELLAGLREIRKFSGELDRGGKGEPDDPLSAALPKLLDMIGQASQAPNAALVAPIATPPTIAGAQPQAPADGAANMPDVSDPNVLHDELMASLVALVSLANINASPQAGAEIVYEKLPDELIELLERDDWFALFSRVLPPNLQPAVMARREWFEQVRGAVMQMLAEDAAEDQAQASPQAKAA